MPQDVPAAIFGNPATLTQFHGTQFTMGGAHRSRGIHQGHQQQPAAGPHPLQRHLADAGFANTDIGVIQEPPRPRPAGGCRRGVGRPGGLGDEYRGLAPANSFLNNVSNEYMVLGVNSAVGVQLDRPALGRRAMTVGTGFEQLGFIGPLISSAMVHDYAPRGTCGVTYDLNGCNTIGAFYQSKMDFQFPNAIRFNGTYRDLDVDQPATIGLGIANHSLMGGDLLLAADVYYKLWDDAALWQDVFVNQWAFAVAAQLTCGQCKYRLGYSYNSSPINHSVGGNLDGNPVGQDIVQLFQAACVPCVNQHRITFGVGREGFLVPNLDLDIFAGFLPKQSSQSAPMRKPRWPYTTSAWA